MIKITKNRIIGSPTKANVKTMKISSILPKIQKNFFFDKLKPQKNSFEIFWRLRWKYIPSFYQCFNQWQHSSAILIAALYCDGPPLWLVEKKVRRKETTWSLPKKFIADNSRTSSFEFLVSSTIMVGNKTHLKFQNITKIKLNFYRAKEYLFSIFIWNLEFLSQDHFSFFSAFRSTGFPDVQPKTIQHCDSLNPKKSDAPESWEKLWYRLDLA